LFDEGRVELRASGELYLRIAPEKAFPGVTLTRDVREGPAGSSVGVAIVAVNHVPFFLFTNGIGSFDGAGSYSLADVVPPGLAGLVLDFQAFAIDARGHVVATTVEELELP
jgi:hypothetical protein